MAARLKSIVLAKCKDALEGLAQTLGWHKARAALAGGSAGEIEKVRNQLKHAQADLAKVVTEAAREVWGPEKPRKVKHDKGYKRLRLRILRLRAMRAAIARAGGQLVPEPLFVRCIKGLKEVRLDPGIPRSAASRWRLWAAWAQTEIRILRWRINAAKLTRSEARGDSREDLFYGKQNQKEFIKRYVTPAPKHVVDSVRLENGARCFDPAVYLSEIDKRVGDIFSRRQLFRRHRGKPELSGGGHSVV